MAAQLPSRGALLRYAEVAREYRQAFREVQDALQGLELGSSPAWVFVVESMTEDELEALSPAVAAAERRRRAWRSALHALTEMIALEEPAEVHTSADNADPAQSRHQSLDRFISVFNSARDAGCVYVNGTFRPRDDRHAPRDVSTRLSTQASR